MLDVMSYILGRKSGEGGGGDITVEALSVESNGTYTAEEGNAFNPVNVSVPNSYTAGDEGKVVSNGALVAQTSDTVTANDTYDTTLINSLTVNVSGGGGTTFLESDWVNVGAALVIAGENSVTNGSQIRPYLLGLAGLPTSDATYVTFSCEDHSQNYENNEVVCASLTSHSSTGPVTKWYRYNSGSFAGNKDYSSSYDAKIVPGTKYVIACYYWKGPPTL